MKAYVIRNETGEYMAIDPLRVPPYHWVDSPMAAAVFVEHFAPGVAFQGGADGARAVLHAADMGGTIEEHA